MYIYTFGCVDMVLVINCKWFSPWIWFIGYSVDSHCIIIKWKMPCGRRIISNNSDGSTFTCTMRTLTHMPHLCTLFLLPIIKFSVLARPTLSNWQSCPSAITITACTLMWAYESISDITFQQYDAC